MATIPDDLVRPLKNERPSEGADDDMGFPAQADPRRDGLSFRGFFLQSAAGPNDKLVWVARDAAGNITFADIVAGTVTLASLGGAGLSSVQQLRIDGATSSTTYTMLARFRFGGTTAWGTPSVMKVISSVEQVTRPGDIRIRDITNNQTIAEITNLTNLIPAIQDLGTLSSLPAAEAVWELQAKKTGGGAKKVFVDSFDLQI
jgi:hypothetical protein